MFKHWWITFGTGLVAVAVMWLVELLPWPIIEPWWVAVLHGFVDSLSFTLVTAAGYRLLVQYETSDPPLEYNSWQRSMIGAAQVAVSWMIGSLLVVLCVYVLAFVLGAVGALFGIFALGRALSGLIAIAGALLLIPFIVMISVASALATAHVVRTSEDGLNAIMSSLELVFGQKWRVFWPSYALLLLAVLLAGIVYVAGIVFFPLVLVAAPFIAAAVALAPVAMFVAGTFVVERAYAPHLGVPPEAGGAPDATTMPQPGAAAESLRVAMAASAAAPIPAAAAEIATQLEQDLRANRPQRLVKLVESGLASGPKFFIAHPDMTLALAKKLVASGRDDLALRVLQPYLKEHRTHRMHFTAALLVANVLMRGRAHDAVRFLTQVKAIYPREPMVDQLLNAANKAAGAPPAAT
jgi:hypothetical protein